MHLVWSISDAQSPRVWIPGTESGYVLRIGWIKWVSHLDLCTIDTHICARGKSPDTPAPPYTCIAQSTTWQAILAAATFIIAIYGADKNSGSAYVMCVKGTKIQNTEVNCPCQNKRKLHTAGKTLQTEKYFLLKVFIVSEKQLNLSDIAMKTQCVDLWSCKPVQERPVWNRLKARYYVYNRWSIYLFASRPAAQCIQGVCSTESQQACLLDHETALCYPVSNDLLHR